MEQDQRPTAKRSLVAAMERGLSWQGARAVAGLHVSHATVYLWYQQARHGDETTWQDDVLYRELNQSCITVLPQVSETLHLTYGHPGRAQACEKLKPGEVPCRIPPMTACGTPDGIKQPNSLVVPQGMSAESRTLSDLFNCQQVNIHVYSVKL